MDCIVISGSAVGLLASPFYLLLRGYRGGELIGGVARGVPFVTFLGTVAALGAGYFRIQSYENREVAIADRAYRLKVG